MTAAHDRSHRAHDEPRVVIIIGAARSGTKILRAAIAAHPRVAEVPHDINHVWKHGNYSRADDELSPDDISLRSRQVIRRYVHRHATAKGLDFVVEKTVSNALRLPAVRSVFPQSRIIHLIRDGRAVTESACRQWKAPLDLRRGLAKTTTLMPSALVSYASRYLARYARRKLGRGDHVSSWGPHYRGLELDVRSSTLVEVCARQWLRCIESTTHGLVELPPEDVLEVRYERLVQDPVSCIASIARFLDLDFSRSMKAFARTDVRAGSDERWKRTLREDDVAQMNAVIAPMLRQLGYVDDGS